LNNAKIYVFALLSYALALLSRENSLILPVLLLLYHYVFKKKIELKIFLPVFIIAFGYILVRLTILRPLLFGVSYTTTLFQRIPGFFVAVTNYPRLLFLPFSLHMQYGSRLFEFSNPRAIMGVLIIGLVFLYAFRQKHKSKLVSFCIFWFFITLLPVSNLYPLNAYMAEHWLYVPSVGFFLLVAGYLRFLYGKEKFKITALVLIIGLVSFYGWLTIEQNKWWKEPIAFFQRTLKYAPEDARIYYNLGFAYLDRKGDRKKAIALYRKAIEIKPDYERAYSSLGSIYDAMGKKEDAMEMFKKAIEANPRYADGYYNLGTVYSQLGRKEEAIELLSKAIEINPIYVKAYNNLANIYKDRGDYEKAVFLYKKALEIDPACLTVYNNLKETYAVMEKREKIENKIIEEVE
jgi:tetratricopeptide (TPR) repeat protein